ncbi:LCP family protein [Priestia sp. SB1]|uniref:LCP family protein n=1 Tax=Priestia sp. SB1 TaxID=3132359 RepID=UPI00316CE960
MKLLGFIKFILSVFFFGVLLYGGYYVFDQYVWNIIHPEPTAEEQFVQEVGKISNIEHFQDNVNLDSKKPFAILLLGVDGDSFNDSRSDTIMVAAVDPKNSKVSLLSIPRDLRVEIPGKSGHDKINAAFARGGVDLTAKTIEETFGIHTDYYATINFKGFQEMVDAIGGLDIDVEKDMTFSDRITRTQFSLQKGQQTLNGIKALNYARFRKDGEGDFGRMRRQQQVIRAIVDQTITVRNIPKMVDIIQVVDKNFNSNVSFKDLGLLALKMRSLSGDNIQSIKLDAGTDMIGGVSYVTASNDAIQKAAQQVFDVLDQVDN